MHTSFSLSKHWKSYDTFSRQKLSTFRSSRPAVLELAAKYKTLISQLGGDIKSKKSTEESAEAERLLFMEMCEICLWGNATDLSLLTSLTYEDIQKLQGADARKNAEKNILVNDLPTAYKSLKEVQQRGKQDRRVDIVLDNAGFELFVDLILAGYLLAAGLATQIVLHPKSIPWFVSDVIPTDFAALLGALANPQAFYTEPADEHPQAASQPLSGEEIANLSFLFQHWSTLHQEGQFIIRSNMFWTSPHGYWSLPHQESALFEDLKQSEMVIFKGDLNYRKLTGDVRETPYHPTTTLTLTTPRQCGTRRPPFQPPSAPWVLAPAFTRSRCAPARLTRWWACQRAKTRGSRLERGGAAIREQGSGLGVASGPSCNFAMGNSCRSTSSYRRHVHIQQRHDKI